MHIKIRNVYMYMILGDENLFVMGKKSMALQKKSEGNEIFCSSNSLCGGRRREKEKQNVLKECCRC